MSELFDPDDSDWAEYQQQAPEYYLRVAGHAIRNYLGWHLSPSLVHTIEAPVGQRGLIMLPSRYITAIGQVQISGVTLEEDEDFVWDAGGWIETGRFFFDAWPNRATVTFTHGYEVMPLEVKQVAYEMVESTIATPVGNVSQMSTPAGYRISLSDPSGFHFNKGQQAILAPYRLYGVT